MDDGGQEASLSRRERIKLEREERILEAAAAVFARKGFHRATIREIAEEADVADGTIYNYYANKRDLLVAITRQVIANAALDLMARSGSEDNRNFLSEVLSDRLAFVRENLDFSRVLLAQAWTDDTFRKQYLKEVIEPLLQLMEGYLSARIDAGSMRPVNTGVIIRAMVGGFLFFVMLADPEDPGLFDEMSGDELARELVDFYLLGLQPKPMQAEGTQM